MVEVTKQEEPLIVMLPEKAVSDRVIVMETVPDATTLLLTQIPFQVSITGSDKAEMFPPLPQPKRKVIKVNEAISNNMYLLIMSSSLIYTFPG